MPYKSDRSFVFALKKNDAFVNSFIMQMSVASQSLTNQRVFRATTITPNTYS